MKMIMRTLVAVAALALVAPVAHAEDAVTPKKEVKDKKKEDKKKAEADPNKAEAKKEKGW